MRRVPAAKELAELLSASELSWTPRIKLALKRLMLPAAAAYPAAFVHAVETEPDLWEDAFEATEPAPVLELPFESRPARPRARRTVQLLEDYARAVERALDRRIR